MAGGDQFGLAAKRRQGHRPALGEGPLLLLDVLQGLGRGRVPAAGLLRQLQTRRGQFRLLEIEPALDELLAFGQRGHQRLRDVRSPCCGPLARP